MVVGRARKKATKRKENTTETKAEVDIDNEIGEVA